MPPNFPLSCPGCTRRGVLKGLIGGLFGSALLQPARPAIALGARGLAITCMDFRFIQKEQAFLQTQWGLAYDWVALAGASLAFSGFPHEAEAIALGDQLALAVQLHQIEAVIILDHRDCGAYGAKIDPQLAQDRDRETAIHRQYLHQARTAIQTVYPHLAVKLYLMDLAGDIEPL